ncbi:ABC transporter permease [Halorhabdus tiamatea]|uniref:ABC transporter permease n=1 Tax=Halorhabdus tiamatea TaxID=430914 RepID=UPI0005D208A0|nr:PrsW family glutamic-type intramembrane protease [Halorhabdus tiamatea]
MRLRKVLRIGWWEVTKNAGGIDRRTAAVTIAAVVVLGALAPLIASQGVALDSGLYRVGVDESSPYYDVVERDPTFAVKPPTADGVGSGEIELLIDGSAVVAVADSPKGSAALTELRSSVQAYNDWLMEQDDNQTAAYPVSVTLEPVERRPVGSAASDDGTGDSGQSDGDSPDGGGGGTGDAGGSGTGDAGTGGTDDDTASGGGGGGLPGGLGGLGGALGGGSTTGSPSDIAPPFPFSSLVLAFVFVLPLNFIIQAYGSSILSERLKRRGELMLVSPVTRGDIIAGKTLPYFLGAMIFEVLLTAGLVVFATDGASGVVSVLAVIPLVLLFLGATFLAGMFARSFKELTFLTVTITVSLTSYAFVPAIFTDVTPIALISPLTLVVRDLQGQAIGLAEFVFSTLPPLLTAAVLFGLGAGLYREEDMFTQRPVPLKVLDSLSGRIKRRTSATKLSIILLPFVLVTELVAVAMAYPIYLGAPELAVVFVLVAVAVIEELAKSLHLYAGFVHRKYARTVANALVVGSLSGLGFFLAEKLGLIVQLLGTDIPEVQQAAFVTGGAEYGVSPLLAVGLLLAPLALHAVTASVSAIGAVRSRRGYAVGLVLAIVIHLAYNLTVVSTLA